jgi:outer membrane protein TolC
MRFSFVGLLAILCVAVWVATAAAVEPELPDRPLALDECVSLGIQLNPSLAVAREGVLSADAGVRRSLSSYYPSATLVATQGRAGGSSFVETPAGTIAFTTDTRRRESEVILRETIWQTGRKESVRRSRHALAASLANEEGALQDLVWSISQFYYQALAAEDLVGVADAALAASRDHEKLVQARTEVGTAARVDLLPAQANAAEAEFALIQAQSQAGLAKARLKNTMGLPQTYDLRLARAELRVEEAPVPSFDEALSLSLERRPEVIALREAVASSEYAVRLAETTEDAVISLSAQYERGITGPREGESWSVVASVNAFLFDGGARKADADAARSGLRSIKAQQQQLVNGVSLEVESALLDVHTARESLDAAEKTVASAEAQLAAEEEKYREGRGIFVEILDAQATATRARTNRVRAMYDYQTAVLALRKAQGTLEPGAGGEEVS